jgi:hypothetical protein
MIRVQSRAARRFILRPKIPIWVYFGGPWNEKCWYILRLFGIKMAVWCSFLPFGIFFPVFGKFRPRKIWQPWCKGEQPCLYLSYCVEDYDPVPCFILP